MTRVYRQARRAHGCILLAFLAVASCRRGDVPSATPREPRLQPGRFELADFLASSGTGIDSPAGLQRLTERGIHWPSEPPSAATRIPVAAPSGFEVAAVSRDGDRLAFLRELDPDSTEVLLHDRSRLETRLLLPEERDARFLPQRFSADGKQLFLFTDEGADTLQLELLDLDTGRRERRERAGCEATRLDSSPDGAVYALQWSCAGATEAALFDAASGAELGPLPLPRDTRLARALPAGDGALYEVASARLPRDLLYVSRLDPDTEALPLTFSLAPTIAAADLVEPARLDLRSSTGGTLPAELWWPGRPAPRPAAIVWLENDARPPAWLEFDPFLQFLANRGVVVLRLRPRGSRGLGARFRHAADGRLADAGLEDLDSARTELLQRGADPQRLAVVGEGPWNGALAALALVERSGRFAVAADLGGAADPLAMLDIVPTLAEPAKSWWLARLGDPASEAARRQRTRMLRPASPTGRWPIFAAPSLEEAASGDGPAHLWRFLAEGLATPP